MSAFGYDALTGRIVNGIKDAREARGMTQTELAKLIGTDKAQMSRIEAGTMLPNPVQVIRLSQHLDAPASTFYPSDPFGPFSRPGLGTVVLPPGFDAAGRKLTRRQRTLQRLQATPGEWVPGMELMNAQVGGTRAGGRIYELRKMGYAIEERRDPEHRSAVSQYRLVE